MTAKVVHQLNLCDEHHLEKKDISGTNARLMKLKYCGILSILCDQVIKARHGHVLVNKQERKSAIVDIAVPGHKRIGEKENENDNNIRSLKEKLQGCGT